MFFATAIAQSLVAGQPTFFSVSPRANKGEIVAYPSHVSQLLNARYAELMASSDERLKVPITLNLPDGKQVNADVYLRRDSYHFQTTMNGEGTRDVRAYEKNELVVLTQTTKKEWRVNDKLDYFSDFYDEQLGCISKVVIVTVDTDDSDTADLHAVAELIQRSEDFHTKLDFNRAGLDNSVEQHVKLHGHKVIASHMRGTHPIIHRRVMNLLAKFLEVKSGANGTEVEKATFSGMSVQDFVERLLHKRPVCFFGARDHWMTNDGEEGDGGWQQLPAGGTIGSAGYSLKDLISYDEIALSAMVSMTVPTPFINNGGRANKAIKGQGDFIKSGIYCGLVGARFEKEEVMEYRFMIVSETQNTEAKGYGINRERNELMDIWAEFYDAEGGYFPTFAEVVDMQAKLPEEEFRQKYFVLKSGAFLDVAKYKQRMQMSIEPFLLDADACAAASGKKAYIHAVGLGLGVWQVDPGQAPLMMEVYHNVLCTHRLENISDINFSWFPEASWQCGTTTNGEIHKHNEDDPDGTGVRIIFSSRNPADPLPEEDSDKLLVAQYAWDGCSYPGNEYWVQMFAASGDPAAACCSTISELQNPEVNPDGLSAKRLKKYPE